MLAYETELYWTPYEVKIWEVSQHILFYKYFFFSDERMTKAKEDNHEKNPDLHRAVNEPERHETSNEKNP